MELLRFILANRRKGRDLQRDLDSANEKRDKLLSNWKLPDPPPADLFNVNRDQQEARRNLDLHYSQVWLRKAKLRYIRIPPREEQPKWWETRDINGNKLEWLSEDGRLGVSHLIKEDRKQRFEWWFTKIILPTLQVLVPLIALILGILSVTKK